MIVARLVQPRSLRVYSAGFSCNLWREVIVFVVMDQLILHDLGLLPSSLRLLLRFQLLLLCFSVPRCDKRHVNMSQYLDYHENETDSDLAALLTFALVTLASAVQVFALCVD